MMRQRLEHWMPWLALAGVSALGLGVMLAFAEAAGWLPGHAPVVDAVSETGTLSPTAALSPVLPLALASPEERAEPLAAIANTSNVADSARARYLLANDLIKQGRGGQAIPLLENLATDYPTLAVHSQVKLGKAQNASQQVAAAQKTWLSVLHTHNTDPATAEALFHLGKEQPQYWDQLIQRFPAHPRSVEVAYQKLTQAPNAPNEKSLLLLMARHGIYHPEILSFLDRLVTTYGEQLTPGDWQAIGFAYWERQSYAGAAKAYSQAPASPPTLYRAARSWQLEGRAKEAIAKYEALNAQFPDAPETSLGLVRHSYMAEATTAIALLDQVVARFPDRAGEALAEKAKLLDELGSPETAAQVRKQLLSQYSVSDEAAELRAQYARNAAQSGNWSGALEWADQLLQENPDAEVTAEISFWSAKWARQAGNPQDATRRFEQVIRTHPESYFAWRSAVGLGWEVGNFQTVRSLQPEIVLPSQRQPLPAGSPALQELYLLGQDEDAWALWQVEFQNNQNPTVEEQFTDGVLRVGVGDTLDGMYMVSSLEWRDNPADQAKHRLLRQHPAYWKTLYPFPFAQDIAQWSAERSLNPLLVTALIRQESRFQPKIRSVVGAVGLMQVMPDTADWITEKIAMPTYNLENPGDNIQLGTWFLDFTHEEYGNHSLYAVASYNAGPGNVSEWIARQNYTDEDDFADKIPFPETKGYILSVFGGYWNYLRLYNPETARRIEALQASQRF
jgi:soluble lytic murein transglycosylase